MRARLKVIEHVPAERKCCPRLVEQMKLFEGKEYEVSPISYWSFLDCPYCGARYEGRLFPLVGGAGGGLFIDLIDLDEGGAR